LAFSSVRETWNSVGMGVLGGKVATQQPHPVHDPSVAIAVLPIVFVAQASLKLSTSVFLVLTILALIGSPTPTTTFRIGDTRNGPFSSSQANQNFTFRIVLLVLHRDVMLPYAQASLASAESLKISIGKYGVATASDGLSVAALYVHKPGICVVVSVRARKRRGGLEEVSQVTWKPLRKQPSFMPNG
jgi:hypothetical protein